MPSHRVVWVLMLVVVAACGASREVSPEELSAAEERLFSPYRQERTIMCDELLVEISVNFHDDRMTLPARNPVLHTFAEAKDSGDDVRRWTSRGGMQAPLQFMVGRTKFMVLHRATMRIRGSRKSLALNATATGNVTDSPTGAALVNCQQVRIQDGLLQRR